MVKTFVCPYCKEQSLFIVDRIVCPNCYAEMSSDPLSNIEHRALIDKKDYYLGQGQLHKNVKIVTPPGLSPILLNSQIVAIYPLQGMLKTYPLAFVYGEENLIYQEHPQTDTLFTKFFIKGMLFSALGNVVIYLFTKGPVWQLYISILIFACAYVWYARKVSSSGESREEGLQKQVENMVQKEV